MLSFFSPYIPTRSRLQTWRVVAEITFLRWLTALIRAAQHESWRSVAAWCAGAAATGLAAGFAGAVLLAR
jgi:hypothetical protein